MSALNARLAPTQDYSDLPADVMDRYNVIEAEQAARRAIENVETAAREVVGERDDLRRRARQERLHALRGRAPLDWVMLNRLNPPADDMPAIPGGRDSDACV